MVVSLVCRVHGRQAHPNGDIYIYSLAPIVTGVAVRSEEFQESTYLFRRVCILSETF